MSSVSMVMKLSDEVKFMLGIVLVGLAGLAGGQVWVLTDSFLLACLAGGGIFLCLWAICRRVGRWAGLGKGTALFGEFRGRVFERDFTERIDSEEVPRQRVQKKVQTRPERVAGSVRALLAKSRQEGTGHPRQDG